MTTWDDVAEERGAADYFVGRMKSDSGEVLAVLAVRSELRALQLTLEMLLTPYPDSAATEGEGG